MEGTSTLRSAVPGWRKTPLIGISQVGYHPAQPRRAYAEAAQTLAMASRVLRGFQHDLAAECLETARELAGTMRPSITWQRSGKPKGTAGPFLWYQREYVIHGAATYIFLALAANKLLNS